MVKISGIRFLMLLSFQAEGNSPVVILLCFLQCHTVLSIARLSRGARILK